MTRHLSIEQIRKFERRRASRAEVDVVSDHLWNCDICYQAYLTVLERRFPIEIDLDELAGLKGWHLQGEELAAYLAGQMNELDSGYASLHLQECAGCRLEVGKASGHAGEDSPPRSGSHIKGLRPRLLPSIFPVSSGRFQVSTIAVLILASLIILWAISRSKAPENVDVGNLPAPETTYPGAPNNGLPALPTQRDPLAGIHTGDSSDKPMPTNVGGPSQSDRERARKEAELAMVRGDLAMPPAIQMFDHSHSELIRGNGGSKQSFSIIGPFSTLVGDDRPTFRWTPLTGATNYKVSVYDSGLHLVRTSEPLTETKWSISDRLRAGIVYTWTVTALKDGQEMVAPASPTRAEFKVLENSWRIALNRRITETMSHAARGVLYAQAGLLDEAEREFRIHIALEPKDERAKHLLRAVKSWRGA